jgi:hypothetical protein
MACDPRTVDRPGADLALDFTASDVVARSSTIVRRLLPGLQYPAAVSDRSCGADRSADALGVRQLRLRTADPRGTYQDQGGGGARILVVNATNPKTMTPPDSLSQNLPHRYPSIVK